MNETIEERARKLTARDPLQVWMHGIRAGTLYMENTGLRFEYEDAYQRREGAIALSQRMPLSKKEYGPEIAQKWFAGLLPEGERREQIATQCAVPSGSDYAMLAAIAQECAGAVAIGFEGGERAKGSVPATVSEIETVLRDEGNGWSVEPAREARLSLAGMQQKLAMVRTAEGTWHWPVGATPSTHILKPEGSKYPNLAWNEHTCLEIARRTRVETSNSWVEDIGEVRVLVVERFDRNANGERIHQEDADQILAMRGKYQHHQGPGPKELCTGIGVEAGEVWDQLMLCWLLGDCDKHAKNVSVQYPVGEKPRLAPVYDLVCTEQYPQLSERMAWRIGYAKVASKVKREGIMREAERCGIGGQAGLERTHEVAEQIRDAIGAMREEGWPLEHIQTDKIEGRCEQACEWTAGKGKALGR